MAAISSNGTAPTVPAQQVSTPIVDALRSDFQTSGFGQLDPLTARLLNVIEQLERSRAETEERLQNLSNRVSQLTQGTIHQCDHCIVNRTLCCLGILPCR